MEMSAAEVDARLESRLDTSRLRHYDGVTHRGLFGIPKTIRQAIEAEDRVITKENPVFMY